MQTQTSTHSRRAASLLALALMLLLAIATAGCDSSAGSTGTGTGSGNTTTGTTADSGAVAPQQYGGSYSNGTATGDTQAGANFARWVLDQDPNRQYITDAVVRSEDNLGVKVQPNITKGDLQKLLVSLAQGMAKTFPNKSLQVMAFYQSGDKLAQANYDKSTNQVSVQFAQ